MRTRICDFIEAHLKRIATQKVIKGYSNENSAIDRVREAIERHNANLDKISFEGIEVDKDEIKMQVPEAFQKNKRVWQTADGSLILEVIQ